MECSPLRTSTPQQQHPPKAEAAETGGYALQCSISFIHAPIPHCTHAPGHRVLSCSNANCSGLWCTMKEEERMLLLRPSSQCLSGAEAAPLPRPPGLQMEVKAPPLPRPSDLLDAAMTVEERIDEEFRRLLRPRYRKCVFGHSHNEIPGACLPRRNDKFFIKDGKKVRLCRVPDCLDRINGYGFVCKTHGGGLCQWPDCTLYYQVRPCENPPTPSMHSILVYPSTPTRKNTGYPTISAVPTTIYTRAK